MYRMIRCGDAYGLVIAVSPADATPDTPDAKFFRYADWKIHKNHVPKVFEEINKELAESYFSGIADGVGFEEVPKQDFPSFESMIEFINHEGPKANEKFMAAMKASMKLD